MNANNSTPAPDPELEGMFEQLRIQTNTGDFATGNSTEAKRQLRWIIRVNEAERGSDQEPPAPGCPILGRNRGTLRLPSGKAITLGSAEKFVLEKLVELGTARLSDLQSQHGRPDRVLKGLVEKYPELETHITLPGGPGRGGYSTTIMFDTSCQK